MKVTYDVPAAIGDAESVTQRVDRKIIWRVVPFIFVCYIVNQLDRLNISFAKLRVMHDIGLSDMAYGFGAGLFFIGYVIFEVPSNLYLQRVGGRATFIRILLLWGSVSAAMAFVRTPGELYLARFVMGRPRPVSFQA
jgi:sugar phosphate permease